MHHYRQIILLFFFIVNIVNRQAIVNRQSSRYRQSSTVKPKDPRSTGVQEIGQCPKKWTVSRKLDSTVSKKLVMYRILIMYRIIEQCTKNNTQI